MERSRLAEYLKEVLIGGLEPREIRIVPYDRTWPIRFEREQARLVAALGDPSVTIEHIGSTAVLGLAAKPVIDIALLVSDVEREDDYLPSLEAFGYTLRVREDGHRMFRTRDLGVHVHVWSIGSEAARRALLFRDWLRKFAGDRNEYEVVKRDLAQHEWPDPSFYAAAKSEFIGDILRRADEWQERTGRRLAD